MIEAIHGVINAISGFLYQPYIVPLFLVAPDFISPSAPDFADSPVRRVNQGRKRKAER